jgi:hypothetical protein
MLFGTSSGKLEGGVTTEETTKLVLKSMRFISQIENAYRKGDRKCFDVKIHAE